jgi:hypothetical protein
VSEHESKLFGHSDPARNVELCLEPFYVSDRKYPDKQPRALLHICTLPRGHYSPGHYCHEHGCREDP